MATVALWYLGMTGALAAALALLILLQWLGALVRRPRRGAHRVVTVPAQGTVPAQRPVPAQRGAGQRTRPEPRGLAGPLPEPSPLDPPSTATLTSGAR